MLEFRPKVDSHLLKQTRVNCAGFYEVDYSNNLLPHCRKIRRQMLPSKVFTVKKTVDDSDITIDLLDSCSKPCRAPSIAGAPSVYKLTQFLQLIPSFCWKLSTTLKMSASVAVVSGVQNRNSSSRFVSHSYLT